MPLPSLIAGIFWLAKNLLMIASAVENCFSASTGLEIIGLICGRLAVVGRKALVGGHSKEVVIALALGAVSSYY